MNKNDACLFLNISEDSELDEVIDAYDLKIFDLKKRFLQTFLIPVLCKSILRKIEQLNEALFLFVEEDTTEPEDVSKLVTAETDLGSFIVASISKLNELRLSLVNTDKRLLVNYVIQYTELSRNYIERLAGEKQFSIDSSIKMTDYPNEMYLVNSAITYRENSISTEEMEILTKEVNRCKNIVLKETLKH